jgi:hypothetical protein
MDNRYHSIPPQGLLLYSIKHSDKITGRPKKYIDAGVNQFFLIFQGPFDSRAFESFRDAFIKYNVKSLFQKVFYLLFYSPSLKD